MRSSPLLAVVLAVVLSVSHAFAWYQHSGAFKAINDNALAISQSTSTHNLNTTVSDAAVPVCFNKTQFLPYESTPCENHLFPFVFCFFPAAWVRPPPAC